MTKEEKNLLNEIKGHLSNGEFDPALELCASFVENFPDHFNGWAYYILAYCRVGSVQELVRADQTVSELPIYADALRSLDEAERQKLITWKEKIERARSKNGTSEDSCVAYFRKCLRGLKADILALTQKRDQCIGCYRAELAEIKKGSAALFSNNPIYFFACCSAIALPFVLLCVYLAQLNIFWLLKFLPLVAAGVIVVLITVKKCKKWRAHRKAFGQHRELCDCNAEEISALQSEISRNAAGFRKLKILYKSAKRKGVMSKKLQAQYRRKFDGIYQNLAGNKEEQ